MPPKQSGRKKNQKVQSLTPMMAQYMEIKAANADSILFYRMGDFFEMFFDDAVQASQALGIHLTHRGKHDGKDIPMCGVPVKRGEDYLQKLIAGGFKVAVCEQMEAPEEAKKRGHKAVVRRDVVRLVTPGTITEDNLLDTSAYNFLTALTECDIANASVLKGSSKASLSKQKGYALASFDLSTGEFLVSQVLEADLEGELIRLNPKELLIADNAFDHDKYKPILEHLGTLLSPVPSSSFSAKTGSRVLKKHLKVKETQGFGDFTKGEMAVIGAVLTYVELTQIGQQPSVKPPQKQGSGHIMVMDSATRINLELIRSVKGDRQTSLLGALDLTVTGAGSRELASRLTAPLLDSAEINRRLLCVSFMVNETSLREQLRDLLKGSPDISRALSRLSLGRGGPRDLGMIGRGLEVASSVASLLQTGHNSLEIPALLQNIITDLQSLSSSLGERLGAALKQELPIHSRDGGFVQKGYHQQLDESKELRDKSREVIMALQLKYSELTGIRTLKVKHNNVLGYFIEVTPTNAPMIEKEHLKETFIHRQTLSSAVRFSTTELAELETRIVTAAERALSIELEIFSGLVKEVLEASNGLAKIAAATGEADLYSALGELAIRHNYCHPKVEESLVFHIRGGRHPVVEKALIKDAESSFIENDCCLGAEDRDLSSGDAHLNSGFEEEKAGPTSKLWLLTGPNMAGKSTFLRQNALITIMAQAGSFVPAREAHIGVVDRLFSRVGASDDLARGRSTFMVEMIETAGILNQAGERSLVILDEIGRGTATYDGLSIAWATVEHLNRVNCCRALFATHYHELTVLSEKLEQVANATIDVREWQDEIIFLHKVVAGAADRSYGIQVAKLAGLPAAVIKRANEVLSRLEADNSAAHPASQLTDLPLFAISHEVSRDLATEKQEAPVLEAGLTPEQTGQIHLIETIITNLNPDELTPKQALEALYDLKDKIGKKAV